MLPERPDLTGLAPDVVEYICALESELARLQPSKTADETPLELTEPPTSINVVVWSAGGWIKRTPRHLYTRQRRGGMGIFDLDLPADDAPHQVLAADEADTLVCLTDFGRAYPLPLADLPAQEIRSKGQRLADYLTLAASEKLVAVVPVRPEGQLVLLTQTGHLRLLRHNYVAVSQPGKALLDVGKLGPLAAAAWIAPGDDVFIATQMGQGIRFGAGKVSPTGSLGIRLEGGDAVLGVCGVGETGRVLLVSADGKGTVRQMSGFRANKMPGAAGKVAMKTDRLAGVTAVAAEQDVFIISKLSKIIRFPASEIPPKEGVVQGVNCISLRADEVAALTVS